MRRMSLRPLLRYLDFIWFMDLPAPGASWGLFPENRKINGAANEPPSQPKAGLSSRRRRFSAPAILTFHEIHGNQPGANEPRALLGKRKNSPQFRGCSCFQHARAHEPGPIQCQMSAASQAAQCFRPRANEPGDIFKKRFCLE